MNLGAPASLPARSLAVSARIPALPGSWEASTVLRPRIGTMKHAESPSPALQAPSPPVRERDGVRGFGSWRARASRPWAIAPQKQARRLSYVGELPGVH